MHGNQTHGMSKTKFYGVWKGMNRRCDTPSHGSYERYGGRGITVCERWKTFDNFYEDMYGSYKQGLQIERINNFDGYGKDNCEWVTASKNSRNKRSNHVIVYNEKEMTLVEWSEYLGINYNTLKSRINLYKRPLEKALSPLTD